MAMTIVMKMLKAKRVGSPTRRKTSSAITQLPTNMMKVRYQISTDRHTMITSTSRTETRRLSVSGPGPQLATSPNCTEHTFRGEVPHVRPIVSRLTMRV